VKRGVPELVLRRAWTQGGPTWLRAGLTGLAVGYRVALLARDAVYGAGLARTGQLDVPVISVGNLTLGGSGKTPTVELAVRTLKDLGAAPAIVSRGYGRRSRGVRVVADRDALLSTPGEAGDEPFLLSQRLPSTPIVVGESRYEGGRVAVERCQASAVVIDDGFQHRTIAKDVEIVAVNGRRPWGNGRLFPRGDLREPLSALRRAHLLVVTNAAGPAEVREVEQVLRRHNETAPLVTAMYRVTDVWEVSQGVRASGVDLAARRLVALVGLASPDAFVDTLGSLGVDVAARLEFPDHHWYEPQDLAFAIGHARAVGAEGLVTTEKDWVRLQGLPAAGMPMWVVPISMELTANETAWRGTLRDALTPRPRAKVEPA
jgi:tetraacyldisaccharide 4'-kinase